MLFSVFDETAEYVKIPLSSFFTSSFLYSFDTWLKQIQFQSFMGKKDLILNQKAILDNLAKQADIKNVFAGYSYFFFKTLLLATFQIQMMNQTNK